MAAQQSEWASKGRTEQDHDCAEAEDELANTARWLTIVWLTL